jgi:hypothetical protein
MQRIEVQLNNALLSDHTYGFYNFHIYTNAIDIVRQVKPQQNQGFPTVIFAVQQNLHVLLRIISAHFAAEITAASSAAVLGTPLTLTPAAD